MSVKDTHLVQRAALDAIVPKADWAPPMFRAKTTFEALTGDLTDDYFHSVSIMNDRVRDKFSSDRFRTKLQGYRAIEVMLAAAPLRAQVRGRPQPAAARHGHFHPVYLKIGGERLQRFVVVADDVRSVFAGKRQRLTVRATSRLAL
jgi:hypothetical protein